MEQSYGLLLKKLDAFTRKYYINQIIRGSLYFVAIGLAAFLASAILEYYGRFSSAVRAVLFFSLAAILVVLLVKYILIPAFRLLKMGQLISPEQASRIIGAHFPDVEDKLLNTLQLKQVSNVAGANSSLLAASIDQRIQELQPVPFTSAVDFGENRRYLKYVLPPVILAILLLIIAPAILTDGGKRIVSYNSSFTPEAPFEFLLQNEKLEVPLNENFEVTVVTKGDYAPSEMNIDLGGKSFKMKQNGTGTFTYIFRNVRNDVPFAFMADGFSSQFYQLNVLPTPSVLKFQVSFSYPKYLNLDNNTIDNTGHLRVPEGTEVAWNFNTKNAQSLLIAFRDTAVRLNGDKNSFSFRKRAMQSEGYRVAALNTVVGGKDTIDYRLEVIKDAYPRVQVQESRDTISEGMVYFAGAISDDHGIRNLYFHSTTSKADGTETITKEAIPISGNQGQEFLHYADFSAAGLQAGDKITYYFEVWDNDGINGSKSTKSAKRSFQAPTLGDLEDDRKETAEKVKEKIEKSIEQAAELKKELKELNKDLLQKSEMTWQDKKKMEDLLKKQKDLERNVNELKKDRKESQQKQENYLQQSENIMDKQKQLEKMFDELMSDEMKEMYRKLEEMMKELDQDKIREQLEDMEMSSEELEKELDRTLEIFKQMEFEQEFEKTMEKLEELAEKQQELSEESATGETEKEDLKQKQEDLKKKFEEVKEDLDELEKKNGELERPTDMPETDEMEKEISEEMEKSEEQLDQNKKKKASESQKNAADKMDELGQKMKAAMSSSQSDNMEEDMDALRALLENIIQLSFDQEGIMESLKLIDRDDPKYVDLGQKQKKLEDDSQMVEDSLFALSKRIAQLSSIVNKEIGIVNQNIASALANIGERRTANAANDQQYVMTSYNNLALLLDEALQQMQMAMANQMPGKGNCEKPGGKGSKPSEGKMSKMQEKMGKKLEEMQKAMEKGRKPGGEKPGMGQGQGMSKEIAKMAAEQAAIRKEIEKMAQELNQQGKGEGKGLENIAEQMEETEKDLVNQDISRETLKRQEDILTRLLESEKAAREREYDNQRESKSPGAITPSNPEQYLEYNRRKAKDVELLRTVPPDLKPYYKDRVNEYFLKFDS